MTSVLSIEWEHGAPEVTVSPAPRGASYSLTEGWPWAVKTLWYEWTRSQECAAETILSTN